MKPSFFDVFSVVVILFTSIATLFAADEPLSAAIAEVGDPPPGVNGDLNRLSRVPGWVEVAGIESIGFGADKWKDDADLSGSLVLGWDPQNLYVAARVRDSVLSQSFTGEALWQGDHVMLLLDVPRQEGVRDKNKIFQIGISPGNLKPGGVAPEIFQWTPTRTSIAGARVGAQKTSDGYQIEAAIPWKSLGIEKVDRGFRIGYDVGFSDSDQIGEAIQDKITSLVKGKWDLRHPDRLVEGILANGDGSVNPAWIKPAFELVQSDIRVNTQQTASVEIGKFDATPVQELIVRARLDFASVAGGNPFLQVKVNGQVMEIDRARNRLPFLDMGPRQIASTGPGAWFVFFSPNFDPIPPDSFYAVQGVDPFQLRFDVSDLWKPAGGNVVEIANVGAGGDFPLVADVGVSERLSRKLLPPQLKPAPTGEIPTFVPVIEARPDYTLKQTPGGAIEITLGKQKWLVESMFSTLTPGWAKLSGAADKTEWENFKVGKDSIVAEAHGFEFERTITRHDDHIQVVDRVTNTLNEDLPLMYAHQTKVQRADATVYLAGVPAAQAKAITYTGEHPASLVLWKDAGLALLGEDDLTRAQSGNFIEDDLLGIRNIRTVVGKGKTVELEFSIYPLEAGEYFDFINRVRRNWNVNFTLDGSHVDTHSEAPGMNLEMSDSDLLNQLKFKNARYGIAWIAYFNFPDLGWTEDAMMLRRQEMMDRLRRLDPNFKPLMYYHAFSAFQDPRLQTDENLAYLKRYQADAILRPDGSQADYSNPKMPLFLPLEGTAWGKASEDILDFRLERGKFNDTFWDEIEYSSVKYDYNPNHWDGVSADIDPNTHRIARKITNVMLATQPWRIRVAEKLMKKGVLVGNGAPQTRSFTKLHFMRFVETSSIQNLILAQLYSPIQLGDHLTERNEVDAYRNMVRGLDFGGVYWWYRPEVIATHETLSSFMFPITPINLGHGFIIGQERIITNRSGLFGWNDNSDFEAIVYDTRGNRTDEVKISRIEKDGKTFAEVRIGEGYSVAIIRK